MSMLAGCIPSKPNHLKLVLACYPSNPLAAAPEFKPNAQELSKLSYYATNRPGKLAKLADVFEKRATEEARRAGGGNQKSRASLLITLAILKQLITDCKQELTLFSSAVLISVKASLAALPEDLEVAARAASVFTAWTAYTDGTLIGVDNPLTTNYLAALGMFAKLCESNGLKGDSENRNRTRIVGLGALSGVVTSAALFHSPTQFQRQVDAIIPPILFNLQSHELSRLREECEIIEAPNGVSSPFLTEFQPQRPLAERRAASIHVHVDGEKGPSKSDVINLSLRDFQALFSPSNPTQVGNVVQAIFRHVDATQLWPNVEWCCWLADKITNWTQFPYRFVIPTRLIELLAGVKDEPTPTPQHTTLVAMITTILSSPKHIINLSTSDVVSNLVQVILRRVAIDPMDGLLPALVTCTAALGTHIYYSDQIQDLAEELINRMVSVQVGGLGRSRFGTERNRSEAIRCLVSCLVGLIKSTEINKGRLTGHDRAPPKEDNAPTEKGKWRASVDEATSDAEKLAVTTSSGRRNPISPEVWQESLATLAESSYGVRAMYARTLEMYIRTEMSPEPYGAEDGIPDDEPIKRVHPTPHLSKIGRQSQLSDSTYRFLNALHAAAYTLAVSSALGLSTDQTAGVSQTSSTQALTPTPINVIPATPAGTPSKEIPPTTTTDENTKRTPSRGRSVSGALALLDPTLGPSSGFRPASPSDFAHLLTVLCAIHERLPTRSLFAGVPMLLALDQATSAMVDDDGAKSRKQATREVIAHTWITIGKMWECKEIIEVAQTALDSLPMPSYLPDLPPAHEDLLHPPELAVDWPELELPNFGESSTSTKPFIDPEVVLRALAANEHVQSLSGLGEDEIFRRLGAEWTVEIALKNCVESTQEVVRPEGSSPWIKISPAIMHIDNHSLQSVSRTSREVGVGDLREALGRGGMSNAALGATSIRSLTSGDRAASVRLAGTHAHGLMAPGTKPLTGPKDVKDVLDRLGVGSPRVVSGGSMLKASFPTIQKEPATGTS